MMHSLPSLTIQLLTANLHLQETIMEYKQPVITATVLLLAIGLLATIANPTTMVMQALVIGAIIISIAVGIDSYQRQHRDAHNTQIVTQKEEEAHILKQNVDNLKTAHSACEAMYELTRTFPEAFDSMILTFQNHILM